MCTKVRVEWITSIRSLLSNSGNGDDGHLSTVRSAAGAEQTLWLAQLTSAFDPERKSGRGVWRQTSRIRDITHHETEELANRTVESAFTTKSGRPNGFGLGLTRLLLSSQIGGVIPIYKDSESFF